MYTFGCVSPHNFVRKQTKGNTMNNETNKEIIIIKENKNGKQVAYRLVRSSGLMLKRRMKIDEAYEKLLGGTARITFDNLI